MGVGFFNKRLESSRTREIQIFALLFPLLTLRFACLETAQSDVICDDGKSHIEVDLPPSEEYTCAGPHWLLPEDLPSVERTYYEQPMIHLCMNEAIVYNETIPNSGPHRPKWAKYGEYIYLPPQRWIHNLEHGGFAFLYHPCVHQSLKEDLSLLARACLYKHVITAYGRLSQERPLALVTFGKTLEMSRVKLSEVVDWLRNNVNRAHESEMLDDGDYEYLHIRGTELRSDKTICPSRRLKEHNKTHARRKKKSNHVLSSGLIMTVNPSHLAPACQSLRSVVQPVSDARQVLITLAREVKGTAVSPSKGKANVKRQEGEEVRTGQTKLGALLKTLSGGVSQQEKLEPRSSNTSQGFLTPGVAAQYDQSSRVADSGISKPEQNGEVNGTAAHEAHSDTDNSLHNENQKTSATQTRQGAVVPEQALPGNSTVERGQGGAAGNVSNIHITPEGDRWPKNEMNQTLDLVGPSGGHVVETSQRKDVGFPEAKAGSSHAHQAAAQKGAAVEGQLSQDRHPALGKGREGYIPTPRTEEAVWAAAALTFLFVVLTLSVLYTRLYRKFRKSESLYWAPEHHLDGHNSVADIIKRRLMGKGRRKKVNSYRKRKTVLYENLSEDSNSE
uniref:Tumor protein p53 inducible protein 13 n=1 Tax=Latimeria chalumnae TaxID=7897 RepID=H3B256_LATCH